MKNYRLSFHNFLDSDIVTYFKQSSLVSIKRGSIEVRTLSVQTKHRVVTVSEKKT